MWKVLLARAVSRTLHPQTFRFCNSTYSPGNWLSGILERLAFSIFFFVLPPSCQNSPHHFPTDKHGGLVRPRALRCRRCSGQNYKCPGFQIIHKFGLNLWISADFIPSQSALSSLPRKLRLYPCSSQRTFLHDQDTRAFAAFEWGFWVTSLPARFPCFIPLP